MIMADVFKIVFIVLGLLAGLIAYWLLFEACFPRLVTRACARYTSTPWRTILVGAGAGVPLIVLGLALANAPAAALKLLGVSLLIALFLLGLFGATGLARHVGGQLPTARDHTEAWRRVFRGGVILSIAFTLPLAGWFFVLPLTLISGLGAFILACRHREATVPVAA